MCPQSAEVSFLNCCGVSDSNYFQSAHHEISIKIVSHDTIFSWLDPSLKISSDLPELLLPLNK